MVYFRRKYWTPRRWGILLRVGTDGQLDKAQRQTRSDLRISACCLWDTSLWTLRRVLWHEARRTLLLNNTAAGIGTSMIEIGLRNVAGPNSWITAQVLSDDQEEEENIVCEHWRVESI